MAGEREWTAAAGTWFRTYFPLKLQDWPLSLLPHLLEELFRAAGTVEQSAQGLARGPTQCFVCCHFLLQHSQPQPGSQPDKNVAWSLARQAVRPQVTPSPLVSSTTRGLHDLGPS